MLDQAHHGHRPLARSQAASEEPVVANNGPVIGIGRRN